MFFCVYWVCSFFYLYDLILSDYSVWIIEPIVECIEQMALHGIFQTIVWRFWMIHYQNEFTALTRDENWIGVITGQLDEDVYLKSDYFYKKQHTLGNNFYTRKLFMRVYTVSVFATFVQYLPLLINVTNSVVLSVLSFVAWLVNIVLFGGAICILVGIILYMSKFDDKLRFVNEFQGLKYFAPLFSVLILILRFLIVYYDNTDNNSNASNTVLVFYILNEICVGLVGCLFVGQMTFYIIKLLINDGLIEPKLNECRILSVKDPKLKHLLLPPSLCRCLYPCESWLLPCMIQFYHRSCCNYQCICCQSQMKSDRFRYSSYLVYMAPFSPNEMNGNTNTPNASELPSSVPSPRAASSSGAGRELMLSSTGNDKNEAGMAGSGRAGAGVGLGIIGQRRRRSSSGGRFRVKIYGRERPITVTENDYWAMIYWLCVYHLRSFCFDLISFVSHCCLFFFCLIVHRDNDLYRQGK